MKIFNSYKKVFSVSLLLSLVLMIASCSQPDFIYKPTNANVTMEKASGRFSLDGAPIVININRGVADEALSLPISFTDENGVYTISSNTVEFEKGQYKSSVSLTYELSALKPVVEYPFTISFDNSSASPAGYSKFAGNAQMPLEYEEWGKASFIQCWVGSLLTAEQRTCTLERAKYTNNYFRMTGLYGSDTSIEFNVTPEGAIMFTSPAPSFYGSLGDAPLVKVVTQAMHPTYGQMTAWLDYDGTGEYCYVDNLVNGAAGLGSILVFDVFYTVSAGAFGWRTDALTITEAK